MVLKGVIIEESLIDKKVLDEINIVKTKSEKVTPSHRTPWLKKWTSLTVEIDEEKMDDICEKLRNSLDKEHQWYIDLKSNRYEITIFNESVTKRRVYKVPDY